MNARTYSAPPAFLAGIPDRLLRRRKSAAADLRRATELSRFCHKAGHHPTFLDLERERARRRSK